MVRVRFIVPLFILAGFAFAHLESSYVVPLEHPAIQYAKTPVNDPIAQLNAKLAAGKSKLRYDPDFGYLASVLNALEIPVSSQVLVFTKTSFQSPRIAPRTPRALYFNDSVSIGWVRGGDVIEVAAADPRQGIVFYTLDQEQALRPKFERRDAECLQCHNTGSNLGVPGLVVRSVFPDNNGIPQLSAGGYVTDHRSPLSERWGGWYVTGTHGSQKHMGNAFVSKADPRHFEIDGNGVTDLKTRFDTGAYLSPHSDVAALMVLEHQTRMQNLITRTGFDTRIAMLEHKEMNPGEEPSDSTKRRVTIPAEELVRYMLFSGEAKIEAVQGTSDFAAQFAARGPKDGKGRSLRDLQLNGRMFRYPLSYLIYSEAFDALPPEPKAYIYQRLHEVLTGKDTSEPFRHLSPQDRRAILEILLDTKPSLPASWRL